MIVPGSAVAEGLTGVYTYWCIKARIPGVKLLQELDWLDRDSRKEAIQIAEELNRLSWLSAKSGRLK